MESSRAELRNRWAEFAKDSIRCRLVFYKDGQEFLRGAASTAMRDAPAALRIFSHQRKRTFSTQSALLGHCACRKLNPGILVMQSAQGWATKNVPGAIYGARDRCIFLQG
jgi:hypothetical protein